MSADWIEDEVVPAAQEAKTAHDVAQRAAYELNKLEKRLCRQMGQAIIDFNMIEEGDRVMVCMSGGKDSYGMLDILLKMQQRAPIDFEIVAVDRKSVV